MKYLYQLIISLILILSLMGCDKDFLNKYPQTAISPEAFFKSEEDLKLYIDGLLSLPDKYTYQSEQGTDNTATTGAVEIKILMTGNPSPETVTGGWSWGRLRDINYFLDNVDNAEVDPVVKNHYIGLARYYRAIYYYGMVKRYSDVPWYSTTLNTSDVEGLNKPRDPRVLVVDSIMADLDFAYKNVKADVPSGSPGKWAIATEYTRIALYEGSWRKYHAELKLESTANTFFQKAIEIGTAIMQSNEFQIHNTGNPETDYFDLFNSQDLQSNSEVILPHIFDSDLGHGSNVTSIFTDYEQSPTRSLVHAYLMSDGRRFTDLPNYDKMTFVEEFQNRDPRMLASLSYPGWKDKGNRYIQRLNKNFTGYHQIKGYGNSVDELYNQSYDFPVFRYAEVLLMVAEAHAELNTINQSILDQTINELRARVGLPDLNLVEANADIDPISKARYPNVSGANTGVILEIRRERRVELAFEGQRFDDINRWEVGELFAEIPKGMYFPGLGKYDMSGDGYPDIELISKDNDIPFEDEKEKNALGQTLIYYRVSTIEDGSGTVYLENGVNGGPIITENTERQFLKPQYYYRPIPQPQVLLNNNLEQMFGW